MGDAGAVAVADDGPARGVDRVALEGSGREVGGTLILGSVEGQRVHSRRGWVVIQSGKTGRRKVPRFPCVIVCGFASLRVPV